MDTSAAQEAGPAPAQDDSPKIKRAHQACLNCRKRKSRCLLDNDGSIPCLRCKRDNLDCVLGGSNRGGRRVRKPKPVETATLPTLPTFTAQDDTPFSGIGNVGTNPWTQTETNEQQRNGGGTHDQIPQSESGTSSDELPYANLQNPSDALGILARVAEGSSGRADLATTQPLGPSQPTHVPGSLTAVSGDVQSPPSFYSYRLLDTGALTVATVCRLLSRYQENYHPYYPLAPVRTFDTSLLAETAKKEPHLLTAILVIASKDLIEEAHIYESCSEYMKELVSHLAAGGDAGVEAVEGLLILAEWAPYTQRTSGKVGKGEEDKESWMHVGLALRIGYFLALDKYSFRVTENQRDKDPEHDRKRLIWTAAYVSDRHISIRIGKAFWSRGPGPMTTLVRADYPSLIPKSPNEEDYASIYQANLELTQLFSNVHDVLYSNPGSSFRSHLSGSYIKFIDDFRTAIYGWKSVWGTLTCSPPLKACLLMSYDYLRLYTNAFAFQATVRRAMPTVDQAIMHSENPSMQAPQRVFSNNVGAVGDARFIYEGLDAAKAILTTANNFVDPEKSLRYMPLRYYLYLVYAGVFLYRARCTGVIGGEEDRTVRAVINETVNRLQRSSPAATGSTTLQHPGSRYSELLKLLWAKVPRKDKASRASFRHPGTNTANLPNTDGNNGNGNSNNTFQSGMPVPMPSPSQSGSAHTGESPAVTEHMGDFGWTDLGAVGDFAINGGGNTGPIDDSTFWNGFLPLDMGWPLGMSGQGGAGWDDMGFEGHELGMTF
ncbi:hypothetical protein BU24DRAFT_371300 [Aaosphaeria arxii CBS 175.79]|uniref:Zn(2)-C6 fungal-type domain-containing protein n=1 Tax=Aaosphaeria arxii CBS 175.79 TaxID=1450172 RepID=A0A6A5XNU6_9PLEO|nr:uncharacterized protein BU24DRAFT_371300 [Aaosphaeria arxii CBS 175.79]KAF2014613.1 hypothetical protein BU24DRAFT_371300 [Aaosphaeria arxii CBS 175.79]